MIRTKIITSAFIGTLVYVALSFIAGNNGFWAYNQLEQQKIEIARHTEEIQNINSELNLEYTALLKDKDVISSYARKLDYVGNGEKIVKINGLRHKDKALYDIGSVQKRKECSYFPEVACKSAGFTVFILTFLIFILIDLNNGTISFSRKRVDYVQGIPVYDVSQIG
ncbi:MAG: septum formation initiator family protein [Treponema sp.]|nr:septum formation initiator family protein [Treponema sp.]